MPFDNTSPGDLAFGQRVRNYRRRSGRTRAVLGGMVGRSEGWVKLIETGKLGMPRIPLLLRMADVLGVEDLADLTGIERLSASSYTKAAHDGLPAVRQALTRYRLGPSIGEPLTASELVQRVAQAWQHWHAGGEHRTRMAVLLPDLLGDLQQAVRELDGRQRRDALAALAETYHLAQLYLSFQPAAELVMLTGDRAMAAAQDADNPHAIASAAWYMNHVFRDAGEQHEARLELAVHAADLLHPEAGPEDAARWGMLQLAGALSFARVGQKGHAWRFWDRADQTARSLGDHYSHPYLIFGRGMVDAYAITMNIDLAEPSKALDVAASLDVDAMPSATRRSFHRIETARAYSIQGEQVAVVHLLKRAYEDSPETARFNSFTRSAAADLAASNNQVIARDARDLARKLGVPA